MHRPLKHSKSTVEEMASLSEPTLEKAIVLSENLMSEPRLDTSESFQAEPFPTYAQFLQAEETPNFSFAYSPVCISCGCTTPCFGIYNIKLRKSATFFSARSTPCKTSDEYSKSLLVPGAFNKPTMTSSRNFAKLVQKRDNLKADIEVLKEKIRAEKNNPAYMSKPATFLETLNEENEKLRESTKKVRFAVQNISQDLINRIQMLEEKRTQEKAEVTEETCWLRQIIHYEKGKLKGLLKDFEKLLNKKVGYDAEIQEIMREVKKNEETIKMISEQRKHNQKFIEKYKKEAAKMEGRNMKARMILKKGMLKIMDQATERIKEKMNNQSNTNRAKPEEIVILKNTVEEIRLSAENIRKNIIKIREKILLLEHKKQNLKEKIEQFDHTATPDDKGKTDWTTDILWALTGIISASACITTLCCLKSN